MLFLVELDHVRSGAPRAAPEWTSLGLHRRRGARTRRASRVKPDWNAVRLEGDVAEAIRKIKSESGPDLQVHGSGTLIQTLFANDLVDELWLKIFPVTIGSGRRLFAEGTAYTGYELTESRVSPSGVIITTYKRAGEVKSGSFL